MNPKINFNNLVCGLLPWTKRRAVRLELLRTMVTPLGRLFSDFDRWRSETRMIVNVTSQVAVFEGYLRVKYGSPIAIKVITFDDGALEVCLEAEGETLGVFVFLEDEPTDILPPAVPLDGELRRKFGDADFIVYIPLGVDRELIEAEIERFKQALTRYKIIQK
ncbi:MAG: hypothetical protein RSB32_07965 [Mucinivorans sp.]